MRNAKEGMRKVDDRMIRQRRDEEGEVEVK
jgi:hypothetical protein